MGRMVVAAPLPEPVVPVPDLVADEVVLLPELWVPEASQWLSTSSGRIAGEGYSWMQAVHWVAGAGLYQPRRHRSHGPRSFGPTTVRVAQELAALSPCRPGIEYLVRRTGLSERSVQNHLQILREAGLLAWIVRGTRVSGGPAQASEFARMIPVEFDLALGIRTVQREEDAPAFTRAACGVAEAGRELMAKLARKAARKVRRPRSQASRKAPAKGARTGAAEGSGTAASVGVRCTPMQVGTSAGFSAGGTSFPPESRLASGDAKSHIEEKSSSRTRSLGKLNRVGRRYQLARELIQELDWLRGCSVRRIAWVARNVADAGWTVTDVRGWLHLRGEAATVRRASGLLAVLLAGAESVLDTPRKRAAAVEQWRGAQEAARRHRIQQVRADRERYEGDWQAPQDRAVHSEVRGAVAQLHSSPRPALQDCPDDESGLGAAAFAIDDKDLADIRAAAEAGLQHGDTTLITDTIHACGHDQALHVYGPELMHRARQLDQVRRSSLTRYAYGA
ncbi:transcriptional regulator [Streptomyces sp. NPDC092046]|uniref:transcriptional regulator n=1 Tax=Streptomyces sp. NPDC092046 TaxID=3366009 RepID=UPI0038211438